MYSRKGEVHVCEDCGHVFGLKPSFTPQRIFISYGRDEHVSLAERLDRDLKARGHTTWFDKDRLHAGHDWEAHIDDGLDQLAAD